MSELSSNLTEKLVFGTLPADIDMIIKKQFLIFMNTSKLLYNNINIWKKKSFSKFELLFLAEIYLHTN
jgi:hypothetical protein